MIEEKIFTVSEFLDFLNEILVPLRVTVQGEVGQKINKYPDFTFFGLLDKDGSLLNCFAWRKVIEAVGMPLEAGMQIRVVGYPQVRKERGQMNFQVQRIELVGEGILKKQFEILKKRLAAAGYFDLKFKKPIPRFSQNIGLITSKHGRGAKKDFLTHLGNFGFHVFFYDVRVEGVRAVFEITEAISWFNKNLPKTEVLVLTRGGGSWESLQPFNSEEIVKAIFSSNIPVITGIGHEDDDTLADFVADLRASTPTHAAKILSADWELASLQIKEMRKNIAASVVQVFKNARERIVILERDLDIGVEVLMKEQQRKVDELSEALITAQEQWARGVSKDLLHQEEKLRLASPSLKLKQGWTITTDEAGKTIKDASSLRINQMIETRFHRGRASSQIKKIKK